MATFRWKVGVRLADYRESIIEVDARNGGEALAAAKLVLCGRSVGQGLHDEQISWDDVEPVAPPLH